MQTTAQPISETALEAIKAKLLGSDITEESLDITTINYKLSINIRRKPSNNNCR